MARKTYPTLLLLAGIYALGIIGIVGSGGSGGDDEDDEIVIQALYSFTIGGPLADDPVNNSTIGIDQEGAFTLILEPTLLGTVICDQTSEVCELQTVDTGSSMLIDDPTDALFTGNIDVSVNVFWLYDPGTDRFVSGGVLVGRTGLGDISALVANCSGFPGVDVQGTSDGTDGCYTWDNFEALLDEAAVTDAVLTAFAWESIAFTVDQALTALEVFPLIVDDLFGGGNALFANCEIYSGNWPAPAPANPGGFLFTWFDDLADGQVGAGDSFRQDFDDCWLGDSTGGTLLQGSIDYVGYTEVIDQNGLLTRIGFESAVPGSGKIGGVALDSLAITITEQVGNDIVTEPPITLTGRYAIVFE